MNEEMIQRIDKIFELWQQHPGAGGQLVVVHKGETILERCYGYGDIEKKIPITQESVFGVASVSKQITAMSIMILQDRGLLNINDDVRKYIPDLIGFEEPVTLSQMLHHTSGMRECFELSYLTSRDRNGPLSMPFILDLIARQKNVNCTAETEFTYCNTGYILLATIVERVSGMTFHQFAKKNIFEPLGMTKSMFKDTADTVIPDLVTCYDDDGYTYTVAPANSITYGSGGLRSTCRDLVKFMPQYKNPTLISKELMEQVYLQIPPLADGTVTNYACGVRINELEGHRYFHHGGVNAGFRTFTVIFPDDDLVLAVYTNTYNIPIETAGRDVARIILGLPARKIPNLDEYRTEGVALDTIPGTYFHDASGKVIDIRLQDGEIQLDYMGDWTKLTPVGGNLYKLGRRDITFAFGETTVLNQECAIQKLRKLDARPDEAMAKSYVGTYYSEEVDGSFQVAWEDGELWLIRGAHFKKRMQLLEGETYAYGSMGGKKQIRFVRDETGTVTGFDHKTVQTHKMPFVKVK